MNLFLIKKKKIVASVWTYVPHFYLKLGNPQAVAFTSPFS